MKQFLNKNGNVSKSACQKVFDCGNSYKLDTHAPNLHKGKKDYSERNEQKCQDEKQKKECRRKQKKKEKVGH